MLYEFAITPETMQLKPEQIKRFKELHQGIEGFDYFPDNQIEEIANGVANFYLTLFKIHQRIKNESENLTVIAE